MNGILWFLQTLLALIFGYSATFKSTHAKTEIVARGQTGIAWYSTGLIRFIAACELFGAIGLILPWLLNTTRVLTPLAAFGLAIIMIGAALSHARLALSNRGRRGRELVNVGTNAAIFCALVFVAIARLRLL